MEAKDILAEAWRAVEEAGVPDDLRPVAFDKAVELIARKAGVPVTAEGSREGSGRTADELVERLAGRLQVPRETVESVFTGDGGRMEISVHPARLSRSKSTGTKELALLVAAMRQAGDEESTAVNEIRRVAQEYDRYDPPNFATSLGELRGSFLPRGSGRERSLKLTRPGWQAAADLVRRLGAGEQSNG